MQIGERPDTGPSNNNETVNDMRNWNLADCLEMVAEIKGDAPALIQGGVTVSWRDFDSRAQTLAAWLVDAGIAAGDQVALFTYNHVAYIECACACMKASMVPVNINHQYKEKELLYLFQNSDARAVLIQEEFLPRLLNILPELPSLEAIIVLGAAGEPLPVKASAQYAELLSAPRAFENPSRSGDDLVFIYTGGTTGMPKGVMWKQRSLYRTLAGGPAIAPPATEEEFRSFVASQEQPVRALILPPLMHGTAFFGSLVALLAGGSVVLTSPRAGFDAQEICTLIEAHRPTAVSLVGDTFARPIVSELEQGDYDISSLEMMASSGAAWSHAVKASLLQFNARMKLFDGLGSSEAHNIGTSVTSAENVDDPIPRFLFGANTFLVDEAMARLPRSPGVKGLIAVAGARPEGYYKDPGKSGETFLEIEGQDCTIPGDWAVVNADGETFSLLGRGSICINTGGEKVFPEEVEAALRNHPKVVDAAVVGIPDERWGQAVVALVSPDSIDTPEDALRDFVREELANYKVPKRIFSVAEIARSPAGKADYKWAKTLVEERMPSASGAV